MSTSYQSHAISIGEIEHSELRMGRQVLYKSENHNLEVVLVLYAVKLSTADGSPMSFCKNNIDFAAKFGHVDGWSRPLERLAEHATKRKKYGHLIG